MFKAKLTPYNETIPLTINSTDRTLHSKSDNFRFEQTGYYKLIDHGTYYYPAWKHYNRKTKVFCDRCYRQNLRAAIGYAQYDLCLLCVDELTRLNFDCPSRHCHESKFINDNSISFSRPEYIDLNRYFYNQHYDMNDDYKEKTDKKQIEKKVNILTDVEHFSLDNNEKNKYLVIFFLIVIIICYIAIKK